MKTIQIWLQLDHIILLFKNAGVSSKKDFFLRPQGNLGETTSGKSKKIHSTQVWRKFRADDRLFTLP